MTGVKGIDVNDGRGDVDWARVVAQGYAFAYVKASEGLDYHDKMFGHPRWSSMRKAGIIRGAYHYARPQPGRTGKQEASFFLKVVNDAGGLHPGDLPLCLDMEWPKCALGAQEILAWCSDFCTTVFEATGSPCVTYTGNFWRDRVKALGPPAHGAMLWLPAYGPDDGKTHIDPKGLVPHGFHLKFHQWTDKGHVDGVQHQPVDCNVWLGTLEELQAFCHQDPGHAAKQPHAHSATADPAPAPAPPTPPEPPPHGGPAHAPMTEKQVQQALQKIGWPIKDDGDFREKSKEALHDFQRGYAVTPLKPSGEIGPKTTHALKECVASGGHCSEHFLFKEFACKTSGWIKVSRELVEGLERYRTALGKPVTVVSAYRDPAHNASVGGKSQSQHLFGNAADIDAVMPTAKVAALGVFSGIGYQHQTGLVRHVDVRHVGPNTTNATLASPTEWIYE